MEGMFNAGDWPDLLVGMTEPDDAAVWRLDEKRGLVVTTDFFTPVVDDAYDYGAIAAANSLSDVYAMGGRPFLVLNVAALPPSLPGELLAEIIRGGAEKVKEAGALVVGGHTVQDKEPKFGLVALGFVDLDHILTKSGAKPGDQLVLSKPLGFGVTTTALKRDLVTAEDLAEVVGWMKRLNRAASELAVMFDVKSATDITGFSLLGHGWEMAQASKVGFRIWFDRVPLVSCARKYADLWAFPGGAADNRLYYQEHVDFDERLSEADRMLLFDPQTSGGLLMAVPADQLDALLAKAAAGHEPLWHIGEVIGGNRIEVV